MTTLREYIVRSVLTAMDRKTAWEGGFDVCGVGGIGKVPVFAPLGISDTTTTGANSTTSGNVLTNDLYVSGGSVIAVNGIETKVGVAVAGSNGGLFTVNADGSWSFDPNGDFDSLTAVDTATTEVRYTVSGEGGEDDARLIVTVTFPVQSLELFASVTANSGGTHGYDPYSVSLPEGLEAGDLVIVAGGCIPWSTSSDPTVGAVTSGYTRVTKLKSGYLSFAVDYKIMGETPDTAVTVGGSDYSAYGDGVVILVYRGVNTTTPLDVTATTAHVYDSASPGTPNNPSITPTTEGALIVPLVAWFHYAGTTPTAPTGYTLTDFESYDPGSAYVVAAAEKEWSGSGAEDPAAWGNVTLGAWDEWAAVTLAIRPA